MKGRDRQSRTMKTPKITCFATLQARDPDKLTEWIEVRISHQRAENIERRGPEHVTDMAQFVPLALEEPFAIYRGIRRGQGILDDWLCYVCAPKQMYAGKMQPPRPVSPGDLFLVWVNGERVAYLWRWEKPDPSKPGFPKAAKRRFSERIIP